MGFGLGLTRLILAMKKNAQKGNIELPQNRTPDIYIAPMGSNAEKFALKAVDLMRKEGIYAQTDITGRSLKAQMKYADKLLATYAVVLGDNELEAGTAQLKNLRNGQKEDIELSKLCEIIKQKLL